MGNIFITSDYHYGHKNICRATSIWPDKENSTRDFPSIEAMNEAIIENTNKTVKENDILIIAGDIVMCSNKKKYWELVEEMCGKINCKNKFLILGNHDKSAQSYQKYFSAIFEYMFQSFSSGPGGLFKITHHPETIDDEWPESMYNLHGHIHSRPAKITKYSMDIGIDGHPEFRPYHIDEICKALNLRSSV